MVKDVFLSLHGKFFDILEIEVMWRYFLAATAGKKAVKEVGEEIVEEVVEKAVKETVEEGLEAGGKKALKEGIEKVGKEEADDIAEVVAKEKGGAKGGWNKTLNGKLKPNAIYDVDGYLYHTDDLGRVTKVEGKLSLNPRGVLSYDNPEPFNDATTWIFNEGSFVPTAKLVNGEHFSIVNDHLGTPIEAYDDAGKKVWSCTLDIYGKAINFTGDKTFIPFRYQGQYFDEETELCYNRFRYYSPDSGTYISQDPIRLESGEPNLYAYVNDTNSWIDEFGLSCGKPTKYHKRTVAATAKLRKRFEKSGGVREKYLKKLSKQADSLQKYGEAGVKRMKEGKVPDGMVVHHKKPLFRGGNNKYDNLDIVEDGFHRQNNKDLHWYPEGQNPYGLN